WSRAFIRYASRTPHLIAYMEGRHRSRTRPGSKVSRTKCKAATRPRTPRGQWWLPAYFFSPARMAIGRRFWRGGRGHVANRVKAHGGLYALLKSMTVLPFEGIGA